MKLLRFNDLQMVYKIVSISILGVTLFLAGIFSYLLPKMEEEIMHEKQATTKNLVEMAVSILNGYATLQADGKIEAEAARKAAIHDIAELRYDGSNYIWISDLTPRMVSHPMQPELNGKDMSDFQDPAGKKLFIDCAAVSQKDGQGFVNYMWPRPGNTEPVAKLSYVQLFSQWGWVVGTGIYVDDVAAQMQSVKLKFITFSGLTALLVMGIAYFISRNIAGRLAEAVELARTVAAGDFSRNLPVTHKDEIGMLARALNSMTVSLREMFQEIHDGVQALTVSSSELSAVSLQMASGSEQTSGKARSVTQAAESMNLNMQSVASASEQTSGNVQVVATATEEMTATIGEIAANAEMGCTIASEALQQATLTSAQVKELGEAVQQIGRVTGIITEISEQTNLLALNATIEAARAGNAGKGFAIVAGEIKELARQTAEATKEIGGQIANIQHKTGDTVARITEISQVIEDLNQIVMSVASAMEEQSVATREIAGSVIMAANGIEEVNRNVGDTSVSSRAIAGDMSEISRSAHEITAGSAQVNGNAQTLSALATQLSQMMGKFTFCIES